MHPISFFFDHIGQTIYRGRTPVLVTSSNYLKLYELQSDAYTFSAPVVKVHLSDRVCESCSA
jgi:hypothetical protein